MCKNEFLKLYCILIFIHMCGIVAIYNNQLKFDKDIRAKSLSMSKKLDTEVLTGQVYIPLNMQF